MVDLIQVIHLLELLLWDLLLLRAMAGRLQELQTTGGDGGHQLTQEVIARMQDATFEGDSARCVDVVPGYHAHCDARSLTLSDGIWNLGQR
ncbi:hypothetical protein CRUP_016876 [Coryphaenoides rupestris]|nr:hypothetical protein CRUP_016876 [Coryphaenoides rupestris]